MQRRSFIRGAVAAIAIGLAPAFLNKTSLELAGIDPASNRDIGTMTVYRIHLDGERELLSVREIPVVDMGVDRTVPYFGERKTFVFPAESHLTEVGIGSQLGYRRWQFDETIVTKENEELVLEYDYRVS